MEKIYIFVQINLHSTMLSIKWVGHIEPVFNHFIFTFHYVIY